MTTPSANTASAPGASPEAAERASRVPPWARRLGALAWRAATGGVDQPRRALTAWIFIRAIALANLFAFWSIWSQVGGLYGDRGISPVRETMARVLASASQEGVGGFELFLQFPTLLLLDPSPEFLSALCGAGVAASLALLIGVAPIATLAACWLLYLSIFTVGGPFLQFQWDTLLLEATLLSLLIAPWRWLSRPSTDPELGLLPILFVRLLAFRLFFGAGFGKFFMAREPSMWADLSALTVFYETQPLPTWLGWWVHQLPEWLHRRMVTGVFVEQLVFPILFFAPRRIRFVAAGGAIIMQLAIAATGNYGFFNLLAIGLCLAMWDDQALRWLGAKLAVAARWLGRRFALWSRSLRDRALRAISPKLRAFASDMAGLFQKPIQLGPKRPIETAGSAPRPKPKNDEANAPLAAWRVARRKGRVALLALLLFLYVVLGAATTFQRWLAGRPDGSWLKSAAFAEPSPIRWARGKLAPFAAINHYGLFVDMTPLRPEIVVEGSHDLKAWHPIDFRYKPGNPREAPRFCAPHMPRLDWQMWFAALDRWDGPRNGWFLRFAQRVLEGSPEVNDLLGRNPFRLEPPRYLRASRPVYKFTDWTTRRANGTWWRMDPDYLDGDGHPRLYCPVLTLDEQGRLVALGLSGELGEPR